MEKELINDMAIEDDVLCKLDDHEARLNGHNARLDGHDKQIVELQLKDVGFEGRFNSIDLQFAEVKNSLTRIENNNYQSTNLLVSTISKIAEQNSKSNNDIAKSEVKNEAEITKKKIGNNLTIILKILGIISLLISSVVAVKYGITIK